MDLDFKKVIAEAEKLKKDFEAKQEIFKTKSFTGSSGGGLVSATINGEGVFTEIIISEQLEANDQINTRNDLLIAAINSAKSQYDVEYKALFSDITGNMGDINSFKDLLNQ